MCFAISAYNDAGYSATYPNATPWWVCAATPGPPAPPSGLTASAPTASTIHLTWQDNSANETGFTIANNFGSTQTTGAGTTAHDWTGLSANTTMCFQVRADNAAGSSNYQPTSPTVCATTPGPPAAPSGLTATALYPNAILLQWADNSANETGFSIANNSGSTRTAAANATQYTWTGIANGATMCFQVRADNTVGSSTYQPASPTVCATTPVVAKPSNVTATQINANTVRIQWTDNSTNETGFGIHSGVNTGVGGAAYGNRSVGANTTSYDWTGLASGMWRCFQLDATSAAGNSSLTNWACVGGTTATAPDFPANITVTAINSSTLRVQWSDDAANEAAWEIDLSTGGFVIALANTTFYDYTGLNPGTQRCFGVGAFNPIGVGFPPDEQGQSPSQRATHCGTTLSS